MKQAKQLISINGQTLLEHAIDQAITSELGTVSVVYGAHEDRVLSLIKNWDVEAIYNAEWDEGLGASIRAGLKGILKLKTPQNLIILLADQPLIKANLIQKLSSVHENSNKLITACSYQKTIGVPAIFKASLYDELMMLKGDKGAKSLMIKYKEQGELNLLNVLSASIDLDTPEDLENFKKTIKKLRKL